MLIHRLSDKGCAQLSGAIFGGYGAKLYVTETGITVERLDKYGKTFLEITIEVENELSPDGASR
jgi:hypothetical protein